MKITPASQELIDHLRSKGLANPNHCYSNAAQIVLGVLRGEGNYILCWVWNDGKKHGHAVIEYKGQYLDVTLQANGGIGSRYEFVKSFTKAELEEFITQFGGDPNGEFLPPALLDNGKIQCIKVEI
jgi:hypothetical protein